MTYTYKLARRLAVSRDLIVLTALALLAACTGDTMAPEAADPAGSLQSPGFVQVSPRSVTIETNQRVRFQGRTLGLLGSPIALPIAWTATGGVINPDGTFQSSLTGTFKVIGRGRGWRRADTSTVTVVSPTSDVTRIAVTPDSVGLPFGGTRDFSAIGYLADGSTAAVGVNWSATGGRVDAGGTYTADSAAGKYRVIATNTAGTLADTSVVTIAAPPPPAPTLTSVVLSPVNVSLTYGSTKQFKAYGRNSLGDSVAVTVAFTATGGTISSGGLYTAGRTGGNYRVVAAASGLADTAVVALSAPVALPSSGGVGVPFGIFDLWNGDQFQSNTGSFTLGIGVMAPTNIVTRISAARSAGKRLVLAMTGGAHDLYKTNGVFDMSKWVAKMDQYNTAAIQKAIADGVADGTVVGNSVMDEPNNTSPDNSWGPAGTMTKARVDDMCGYVKQMFPTLPVGVVHDYRVFEPDKNYAVCDFVVSQYRESKGTVTNFRDGGLAFAARSKISIAFSLNILDGGTQISGCPVPETGGTGTYGSNCRMRPDQVRDYGLVLGAAGCVLSMWRYDAAYMADADNQRAFKDVASNLATLPRKDCRRT